MSATKNVYLLWGEDDFLLREEAMRLLGNVRAREVDGLGWQGGELADLVTPSLFGETRALLISGAKELPAAGMAELGSYLAAPDPQAILVMCCRVGERSKAPAALQKMVEPVGEVRQVAISKKDLSGWLIARARESEIALSPAGASALVEIVGVDPAQLAAALEQLSDAYPGERIGPELVQRQFRGLGDQKSWDLCDRAFSRDLPGAIRSLRAIEEAGDDPLMVLGAMAARLRDLIRVRALPERMPPAQLAREAGLRFDWQARRYRQQASNFSIDSLVGFQAKIAEADRALKSGAEGSVLMPVLIASIAAA